MLGQTSLLDEKTLLPLQVEADQAAVPQDVSSWRSARFLWTGLGLASLLLIGIFACALHPLASHAFVEPARLAPELASFKPMPAVGSRGSRGGMVYTSASLPHIGMAADTGDDPEELHRSDSNPHLPPLNMSLATATPIHQSSVYTQKSNFINGEPIPERGTSGRLLEAVKAAVQKEVDIVGGDTEETIQWQKCRKRQQYSGNSFFEQRMRVQMLAALQEELLLAGVPAPKKHMCVFDFDGTLTNDFKPREGLGDAQRIADLREFLETLHADAHIVVCSMNNQHYIVDTLRRANLLDLFDIVVDAYHMAPLGGDKGRALNELLLPLFPSVAGPGNVLFVDDNVGKIREVKVSAPACKTFMCSRYGLSSDDMRLLLNEESSNVQISERVREQDALEAKALWEGGEAGRKKLWLRQRREQLKNAMQMEGSEARRIAEENADAMQMAGANLRDLQRAIKRASGSGGLVAGFPDDESDVILLAQAEELLPHMEALAARDAKAMRDAEMP